MAGPGELGVTPEPAAGAGPETRSLRSRLGGVAGSVGAVIVVVASIAIEVAGEGNVPLADAVLGLILLAVGLAAVAAITYGFVSLRRHGRVWSGRVGSLVLLVASAWALVLAVEWDNSHRYANGQATGVGQGALLVASAGIIAGLVGIGVTWRPLRPADCEQHEDSVVAVAGGDRMAPGDGYPAEGAEPPFEFRVPGRSAWHVIVLPVTLVILLVLSIVSVVVHDPAPVVLPIGFLWILSPLLLPLILRSYWRRLTVLPEGLSVVRMGTDRFIPWSELREIELESDPDSQGSLQRMRLITSRGRYVTDVPKGDPGELAHWREVILAARPANDRPTSDDEVTRKPPVAQRLLHAVRVRRRGAVLLLMCTLLGAPILLGIAATGH